MKSDDGELSGEFIFGMISNSTSVGGFKRLTGPDVMLDDGVFEVMFIRRPKNILELNEIIASLVGTNDSKMIEVFKTTGQTKQVSNRNGNDNKRNIVDFCTDHRLFCGQFCLWYEKSKDAL